MTSRSASRSWGAIAASVLVALVLLWLQSDDDPDTAAPSSSPSSSSSSPSSSSSSASSSADPASGLAWVDLADLPPEAAETVDRIDAGGPFTYDQDDETFGNFEGLLPEHERGYYREYTVETPGSADRGARRIVAGSQGELYWTEDHYASFERIRR